MGSQAASGIRVMLVDAHRIVVSGLERLIDEHKPALSVVATATECARALELAAAAKPDVVVIDVELAIEKEAGVVAGLINGGGTRVLVLRWSGPAELIPLDGGEPDATGEPENPLLPSPSRSR